MSLLIPVLKLILALGISFAEECGPKEERIPRPNRDVRVDYMRVHPSGDYVMFSGNQGATIVEFKKDEAGKKIAVAHSTPMNDEVYPVEGSWTLLASPNHNYHMKYYRFDDVLKNGTDAKEVFSTEFNQYYHSSAEMENKGDTIKFRTALWSQRAYRDYEVTFNSDGTLKEKKESAEKKLCTNFIEASLGTSELKKKYESLVSERDALNIKLNGADEKERLRLTDRVYDLRTQLAAFESPENPILSKDGQLYASTNGVPLKTAIYKINSDGKCAMVKDFGFRTSKVSFSYPEKGKLGRVAFTADMIEPGKSYPTTSVFVYDLDQDKVYKVSNPDENPQYPGFTKDGHLIYSNSTYNSDGKAFVIKDLNQIIDGRCGGPAAPPAGAKGKKSSTVIR